MSRSIYRHYFDYDLPTTIVILHSQSQHNIVSLYYMAPVSFMNIRYVIIMQFCFHQKKLHECHTYPFSIASLKRSHSEDQSPILLVKKRRVSPGGKYIYVHAQINCCILINSHTPSG